MHATGQLCILLRQIEAAPLQGHEHQRAVETEDEGGRQNETAGEALPEEFLCLRRRDHGLKAQSPDSNCCATISGRRSKVILQLVFLTGGED